MSEETGVSWWVGLGRPEFMARVTAQQERLQRSTFGKAGLLITAPTSSESDTQRARRAAQRKSEGYL